MRKFVLALCCFVLVYLNAISIADVKSFNVPGAKLGSSFNKVISEYKERKARYYKVGYGVFLIYMHSRLMKEILEDGLVED